MSRFYITLKSGSRTDPAAVIGYDRPMRTYFLQGFPIVKTDFDDFEIWLGLDFDACKTLEILIDAAKGLGYEIQHLPEEYIVAMATDEDRPFDGPDWSAFLTAAGGSQSL